ncbi:TetR/AcrR family transcriptional regulator [Acidimicrobiia bacterium EGI L10123]|uniref:TetR/AcrR family transcriptional regulator n=1 Tax=Salinilacustrithrix flava TaxID=2957203 RepID=UPI003D7C1833|nr:TetR/AcrR family transcriptional regulator [Acidimicrobiia bacterium EGI L10123]
MSSRLPAARRREQLLEVALHVFAARGFHQTSMNDVAEAAGVTKPVLYQHFTSKRALYLELLELVSLRLMAAIDEATSAAAGPREQVVRGLRAYFRFVVDSPDEYQLMFGGGTRRDAEFAQEAARLERSIAEVIADLITVDGLAEHERVLLAHGIVGLAEGATRHWLGDELDLDADEITDRVADLAWRGLRGIRSEPR